MITSWQELEREIVDILKLEGINTVNLSGDVCLPKNTMPLSISSFSRELFARINPKSVKVKA